MILRPDLLATADKTALQGELKAAGFYSGKTDGIWGPQSAAAFAEWQGSSFKRVIVDTDLTAAVRTEFERMFELATIQAVHEHAVLAAAHQVLVGRTRYEAVAASTGVPWHVIGLIHQRECDSRFDEHLHNGDPLSARTVHEPAGRPLTGHAPFEWAYSAADALLCDGLTRWKDWSLAGTLHKLEAFNGYGYRLRGLPTPYLWSYTSLERPGKFVADGKFNPTAMDKQPGCVAVINGLMRLKALSF